MEEEKSRGAFYQWLLEEKRGKQTCMIGRAQGEEIIRYLRDKREKGEDDPELRRKYDSALRASIKKKNYKLLSAVGLGDILCLPVKQVCINQRTNFSGGQRTLQEAGQSNKDSHAMLGQNRQVIFKEDMYDVIMHAHVNGKKHKGYKGTYDKINETYCSIPRQVVYKFVELCGFCVLHHACYTPSRRREMMADFSSVKKAKKRRKRVEFPDEFLTRCQVDIIDMTKRPDGQFSYIGHFFDHHTKYNMLFPLKSREAIYVAKKFCRHVLGNFGLPRILHSNMDRNYVDDLIHWVVQFWSTDVSIINGDPQNKKALPLIQQRQRTIMILIETIRARQNDSNSWATWLPGIQYSLNTNEFERDLPASYDIVFKARPRCYSYSIANSEVQKEEELYSTSDDEAEMANSESVDRSDDFNQATFVTPMSKNTTQIFDVASPVDILPAPAIAPTDAITHVTLVQKSETSVPPSELVTSVSMVHENKPLAVLTFPPDPIQKEQ